ncbi:unnamed protein product [Caretta caretta]
MPSYVNSVWTKETTCKLLKTNIKDKVQCSFNNGEGDENIFQYPCLEVLVDLNFSGQEVMLYHTEETQERNPKCSYIPQNLKNDKEVKTLIESAAENFRKHQTFPCYYDPEQRQTSVILIRLYPPKGLFFAFLWPSLMLTDASLIRFADPGLVDTGADVTVIRDLECPDRCGFQLEQMKNYARVKCSYGNSCQFTFHAMNTKPLATTPKYLMSTNSRLAWLTYREHRTQSLLKYW